ncbi:MAG: squalene/phytoene synthase family protein [Nannocystaceae bacterium]
MTGPDPTTTWEQRLFDRATIEDDALLAMPSAASTTELDAAYRHCAQITRDNSTIVRLGAALLPADSRPGLHALYAMVRVSDDLSEQTTADRHRVWARWRDGLTERPRRDDPVSLAWADAARRHRVPRRYVEQFLDGLGRDLDVFRMETFDEYVDHCYEVACTTPLMAMHVLGDPRPEAIPYAVRLGVALQLTNDLRDVGQDLAAGRMYLPRQELAAFGLSEADLPLRGVDDRWRRFMRVQVSRTRQLYRRALPGIDLLPGPGRLATGAIAELYLAMLDDIEAHDYDVFDRRAGVSDLGKLRRLPGIWYRARRRGYGALVQAS